MVCDCCSGFGYHDDHLCPFGPLDEDDVYDFEHFVCTKCAGDGGLAPAEETIKPKADYL